MLPINKDYLKILRINILSLNHSRLKHVFEQPVTWCNPLPLLIVGLSYSIMNSFTARCNDCDGYVLNTPTITLALNNVRILSFSFPNSLQNPHPIQNRYLQFHIPIIQHNYVLFAFFT